jgi:hypothetical protein
MPNTVPSLSFSSDWASMGPLQLCEAPASIPPWSPVPSARRAAGPAPTDSSNTASGPSTWACRSPATLSSAKASKGCRRMA